MAASRTSVVALLAAALLGGCALNQLRVEKAQDVERPIAVATDHAAVFLDEVERGREAANVDLVAADPICGRAHARLRRNPAATGRLTGSLCAGPGSTDWATGFPLSLEPITDDMRPVVLELAGLAAYGDGLAAIVDRRAEDVSAPFLEALALARSAQDAALALAGRKQGPVPAANDPRVKAVAALVDLLGDLQHEAEQVSDLRAFLAAHPDGARPVLARIRREITGWDRARSGDDDIRLITVTVVTDRAMSAEPPVTADARGAALAAAYARRHEIARASSLAPALLRCLDLVQAADDDLVRVLATRPHLTKAEAAEVSALNRRRITAGLESVAALARAAGGI